MYRVADEEEARALIVLSCPTTADGEHYAPELATEQTLENLEEFSARLDRFHDILIKHGQCRCGNGVAMDRTEAQQKWPSGTPVVMALDGYTDVEQLEPIDPKDAMYRPGDRVLFDVDHEMYPGEEGVVQAVGEGKGMFYAGETLDVLVEGSDEPWRVVASQIEPV